MIWERAKLSAFYCSQGGNCVTSKRLRITPNFWFHLNVSLVNIVVVSGLPRLCSLSRNDSDKFVRGLGRRRSDGRMSYAEEGQATLDPRLSRLLISSQILRAK